MRLMIDIDTAITIEKTPNERQTEAWRDSWNCMFLPTIKGESVSEETLGHLADASDSHFITGRPTIFDMSLKCIAWSDDLAEEFDESLVDALETQYVVAFRAVKEAVSKNQTENVCLVHSEFIER